MSRAASGRSTTSERPARPRRRSPACSPGPPPTSPSATTPAPGSFLGRIRGRAQGCRRGGPGPRRRHPLGHLAPRTLAGFADLLGHVRVPLSGAAPPRGGSGSSAPTAAGDPGRPPVRRRPRRRLPGRRRRRSAARRAAAGAGLLARTDLAAEERYLFYTCVAKLEHRLHLSYPAADEAGGEAPRSPFVDEVRDPRPGADRAGRRRLQAPESAIVERATLADFVPAPDQASAPHDLARALAVTGAGAEEHAAGPSCPAGSPTGPSQRSPTPRRGRAGPLSGRSATRRCSPSSPSATCSGPPPSRSSSVAPTVVRQPRVVPQSIDPDPDARSNRADRPRDARAPVPGAADRRTPADRSELRALDRTGAGAPPRGRVRARLGRRCGAGFLISLARLRRRRRSLDFAATRRPAGRWLPTPNSSRCGSGRARRQLRTGRLRQLPPPRRDRPDRRRRRPGADPRLQAEREGSLGQEPRQAGPPAAPLYMLAARTRSI